MTFLNRLVKRLLRAVLIAALCGGVAAFTTWSVMAAQPGKDFNLDCEDGKRLQGIIDKICWSCVLPMRIMGVGPKPAGAAPSKSICMCNDSNGVPEIGWQLGYFQPARVEEVVKTPWCSPFLGGIKLQDSSFEVGRDRASAETDKPRQVFMDSHYFTYPIFQMLNLLMIPSCAGDNHMDLDLLTMSEIDPLWSNDLLTFVLNPESVVFANPLALAWCMADCVATTLKSESEKNYFCAGCDGLIYPHTGNIHGVTDPVQNSSLLLQRQLASLHRRGLAEKTMGEEEMCESSYSYFIPRSQYRVSMLYPVPESKNSRPLFTPPAQGGGGSSSPSNFIPSEDCCHRLGESVHQWSTLKGGRSRPGKENYVFLVWRYVDCCVGYMSTR